MLVVISADPDAIASAMAVGRLLWRKVDSVTISCVNAVDRPDNLAMIRLLKVALVPFAQLPFNTFTKTVLVDSQPSHHKLMARSSPQVVIDHHPDTGCSALFTDIRPTYGATATILTEYLRAARIIPSRNLATALYHAIKTDTDDFKRQTLIEDVRAFQYLFRRANIPLARRISQAELRLDYLKYFKTALLHMRLRKGRVFVHLGPVANTDICVIIADFFMRIHTVRWSIVSGTCDSKLVVIFRNDGSRKNAGRVAKESLGCFGSAGGHKTMARAEINLAEIEKPPSTSKTTTRSPPGSSSARRRGPGIKRPPPSPLPRSRLMDEPSPDIRLTILGSGTCVPSLTRSSCSVLVESGGCKWLIDCGPGTLRRMLEAGTTILDISHLLFSHLHPDHTADFVPLLFATKYPDGIGRTGPLTVVAGQGFADFMQRLKNVYGHWIDIGSDYLKIAEMDARGPDHLEFEGVRVDSAPMEHSPQSVGIPADRARRPVAWSTRGTPTSASSWSHSRPGPTC